MKCSEERWRIRDRRGEFGGALDCFGERLRVLESYWEVWRVWGIRICIGELRRVRETFEARLAPSETLSARNAVVFDSRATLVRTLVGNHAEDAIRRRYRSESSLAGLNPSRDGWKKVRNAPDESNIEATQKHPIARIPLTAARSAHAEIGDCANENALFEIRKSRIYEMSHAGKAGERDRCGSSTQKRVGAVSPRS